MKARKLKEILGTEYIVADFGDYIGIGSPLCHNLISIDKETRKMAHALSLSGETLDIWNRLVTLIQTKEFDDIVNGDDSVMNPVAVYYAEDGVIHEEFSEAIGWPNITQTGRLQHDNTDFASREEAIARGIARGIDEAEAGIKNLTMVVDQKKKEIWEAERRIAEFKDELESYKKEKDIN